MGAADGMKSTATIHLGFEVASGSPVEIPIRHMAVTGQTQEAGKTTTLEALIDRAELRALTFVTKRGEGAFTSGRPTAPYFREQADWRFVSSLLEAFLGERLKFERSWIMRATKKARTLADVRRNIQTLQLKAKGLSADVYMVLGEYLDELVPAIAAIEWAPRVELAAGVNVMDLASVPTSMQHLVIKSSIDWVLEHEEKTVVVVPEAWKFIPQGRGTPVKLSAMAYIRQGAALENYLWLDSQDIGGVDKELLRSVPVWILGVQREANEIKRTLSNIPATVAKPKAADIALLELGQFFACWGKHAIRTYVQPAWMRDELARDVATGKLDARNAAAIASAGNVTRAARRVFESKEDQVTKEEAAKLKDENDVLRRAYDRAVAEGNELRRRLEALEKGQHDRGRAEVDHGRAGAARQPRADGAAGDAAAKSHGRSTEQASQSAVAGGSASSSNGHVDEALYQAIKARLLEDEPILLKAIAVRPEVLVEVRPKIVPVDGDTQKGRLARLMAKGWFDEPRAVGEVRKELARTGKDPGGSGQLGIMLNNFVNDGFFVREGGAFVIAPGVKVSERELQIS
jgi:hypothetical protein